VKNDIILFLDAAIVDEDLQFEDLYLPEYLFKKLQAISDIKELYYSIPKEYSGKLAENEKSLRRHTGDDAPFWKGLFSTIKSDTIIKIFLDSPFLDVSIIEEMLALHLDSLAEFTFSENLPSGLTAEIISKNSLNEK
jgi:spore coat polysaccharide biosynthesis protein SpsF (cytidylyltransferase family)